MQPFYNARPLCDAELIRWLTQDVNRYLDRQQRFHLLWADVDNHIAASHLAETLGNVELVSRHLQAVTKLLEEIYSEYPWNRNTLKYWYGPDMIGIGDGV
jgi:hypothetical protein